MTLSAGYRSFCAAVPLLALILTTGACSNSGASASAKGSNPRRAAGDVPVTVAKVAQKDVPLDLQVIGNVEAYSTITVKAQVGGQLTKAFFKEGDFVKKGEVLFTIDRRPLEAQVHQAEAMLAKNQAQLKQAEANLARDMAQTEYAKSQAARYAQLAKEGVLSKEQNDQSQTAAAAAGQGVEADRASIDSAKADIAATQATLENLRVMMSYTLIRSPINGRTGNLAVKEGNIVTPGTTDLMTINEVKPIYVTFFVPEAHLPAIKQHMALGKLKVFATPQDGRQDLEGGVLTFTDNTVDASTGTIKLKGTFPNTDGKLWPGEFVRVVLRLETQPNALVIPNQAVQTGQDGSFVYVVKPDRSVEARPVVTGARIDQELVVERGLKPGETVVVEGQLRLAPGMKVQVRDGSGPPAGTRRRAPKS